LLLEGDNQAQGLLRSFAHRTRQQSISLAAHGEVIARSYDDRGRLVDVASGRGGRIRATVAPGGFTIIRATRDRGPTGVVAIGSQPTSAGAPSR